MHLGVVVEMSLTRWKRSPVNCVSFSDRRPSKNRSEGRVWASSTASAGVITAMTTDAMIRAERLAIVLSKNLGLKVRLGCGTVADTLVADEEAS